MTKVVEDCERTWRRLGVERGEIQAMSEELAADLESARVDGIAAEAFVGGDPVGFARAWASARGVVRPRWRIASTVSAAAVGTLPGAAVALMLGLAVTSPWFIQMVDPDNGTLFCLAPENCGDAYLALPTPVVAGWYLLALLVAVSGALVTVSAWLRWCADPARRLTLQAILVIGPFGALIAGALARIFDSVWGPATVDGHFRILHAWPTVFIVMMLGLVGAARWWAVKRSRTGLTSSGSAKAEPVPLDA